MTQPAQDNPIAPAIQALVDLFRDELSDVKFPDVDRSVLEAAVTQAERHALEVAHAEEALQQARAALQESQEVLLARAQRALAYARIFAEEDDALLGRIDAITLPRGRRTAKGESAVPADTQSTPPSPARRRGRPPRSKGGMLFSDDGSAEPGVEAVA